LQIFGDDYPTPDASAEPFCKKSNKTIGSISAFAKATQQEVLDTVVGNRKRWYNWAAAAGSPTLVAAAEKLSRELGWKPKYPDLAK
jgi:UDP-glucose 4-epimerase